MPQEAVKKKVSMIPAKPQYDRSIRLSEKKLRVAAYCRVSTELEEQESSYEAQVEYYTRKIQETDNWKMAGIYADDGKSATNTKKRDDFNAMIKDALDGKIDMILTKSVSRFARNTVDSLLTIRRLKEKNVAVVFEKEGVNTLDGTGEILITILSSLAQEESRSISENVTWGHRKRFADGKVSLAFSHFLGYDRGMDGNLIVNKKQAEIVKLIYRLYLSGYTFHSIAKELTERKIPTPAGCKIWRANTIRSILMNEKYKGDALLQKKITVDFLTKETKKNEGEVPQYYVEHNHEAIISPQVFDWVQEEIKRRRKGKKRYCGVSIFSSKIKCGPSGGWYGAKVWHSTDKYRRTIYRCSDKFKRHCQTPHLTEDDIKEAFVRAANRLIENKAEIIDNVTLLKERLTDTEALEEERDKLSTDLNLLADKIQQLIAENARVAQNQDDYDRNYNELVSRYEAAKTQYDKTCEAIQYRKARSRQMDSFIKELRNQDLIKEFDARLWGSLVDFITVYSKDDIRVTFKDGTEIRA